MANHVTVRTDGGARGNPGLAGIGFTLEADGVERCGGGAHIGETTNNVAEYLALVWGLENALRDGASSVSIYADSELIVKQVRGEYRVKAPNLKPHFQLVRALMGRFERAEIAHVYRADNKVADGYANEAMDARGEVGNALVPFAGSLGDDLNAAPTSLF